MKRFAIFFFLLAAGISAQAQLKGKIQEFISGDAFFKQLRATYETVQGKENTGIPNFLEKTMQHPERISLADFKKEKARYYALCTRYNGIIDDIVTEVDQFDRLRDLREISLIGYESRIQGITKDFQSFFQDLNKYHQEALVLDLLINVYKFAKPLVTNLINESIESVKRILKEELKSLKLTPVAWEPTEAVVASQKGVRSHEEIVAKLGMNATLHYRSLNLAPGVTTAEIKQQCAALKQDYAKEIQSNSNPDIKEFFEQLAVRVDAAQAYFEQNPPQAAPVVVAVAAEKGGASAPSAAGADCTALKAQLEMLLRMGQKENMTKQDILDELRVLVE